ncbi:MAG: hypothetical protein ACLTEH_04940 [Clostridia bacterium]
MKEEKGITLISLVVTIIILIILAGVSMNMLVGDNGIITKAQQAKENTILAQGEEQKQLNSLYEALDGQIEDSNKGESVYEVTVGNNEKVPIPYGFWYVGGDLSTGVIISDREEDKYNKEIDKTTWEYTTKLKGNQFVWIPCTEEEYHKTDWGSLYQYSGENWDRNTPTSEKVQIQKYGGFYVARYEAGLGENIKEYTTAQEYYSTVYNIEGIPQSKAGKIPWTCVSYDIIKKIQKICIRLSMLIVA